MLSYICKTDINIGTKSALLSDSEHNTKPYLHVYHSYVLYLYLFLPQDFISKWSLGNEAASEEASSFHLGLAWLIPLWVDRDQEVQTISSLRFS